MNNEYFAEMHKLIEKAKTYERIGREEEALKTYLEIHERFFPNTSDLFERPAILLEKRKRFEDAIHICEKAIKLINEGKVTGIKENFERRIRRIKSRSDYTGPKEEGKKEFKFFKKEKVSVQDAKPVEKPRESENDREAFHWPKLKWHIRGSKEDPEITEESLLDGPRIRPVPQQISKPVISETAVTEKPPVVLVKKETHEIEEIQETKKTEETKETEETNISQEPLTTPAIIKEKPERFRKLKAYLKGFKTEANKIRRPTRNELIAMAVIVVFIGGGVYMINNKPKSQFEVMIDISKMRDGTELEGSPFEKNLEDFPPVTQTMIDVAVKETQALAGVKQAGVIVQKDVIGFVVMLKPGTSKGQAKDAAEVFVKSLSRAAAAENPQIKGPGPVGYGELFDYYTLLVVAGENYDNLILKGSKNPKVLGIYWRDDKK